MKVLVTGGTGFLGKQLAFRLQALGYQVSILGRNTAIGKQLTAAKMQFLPTDLTDTPAIIDACREQDYVFHCGALSSPWGNHQKFYNTNVLGTRNLIQGCKIHGIQRLIHVSTSAVYFDFSHRFNISDSLPTKPVNAYAQTKRLAEIEIQKAHQEGLPVITIRPRGIFGPGDTAILPRLIRANQKIGIPFIDQGNAVIDITYIDNVVDALILCKDADSSLLGGIFNISNNQPINVANLLTKMFEKLEYPLKLKPISYQTADWLAAAMELIANTVMLGREPPLTRYTVGLLAKSNIRYYSRLSAVGISAAC
jgi:nucleoside-diphosphate-sugar epimerase